MQSGKNRSALYKIVFENDTFAGRAFDVALLWLILTSVVVVVLESIPALELRYANSFFIVEAVLTIIFTAEYITRLFVSPKPMRYALSGWGIIDLLSIIPFYLGLVAEDYHYFLVLRMFRLLRVFRILKLFRFISEAQFLYGSLRASAYRIGVFISGVLTLTFILGTMMYVVEGQEYGFSSIPKSIYWTIVTITTVGYGDLTPQTPLGQFIASVIMMAGYAIIAIPTGIVTIEMTRQRKRAARVCPRCRHANPEDANYCNACGTYIDEFINSENATPPSG